MSHDFGDRILEHQQFKSVFLALTAVPIGLGIKSCDPGCAFQQALQERRDADASDVAPSFMGGACNPGRRPSGTASGLKGFHLSNRIKTINYYIK